MKKMQTILIWRIQYAPALLLGLCFLFLSPAMMGQFLMSQPGFSLRVFPDTPFVGFNPLLGTYEEGPTTTVENQQFVVSARRINRTDPTNDTCYILFIRLEKSTQDVLYKLIELPGAYTTLNLGMDLTHDEEAVMIATVFESKDLDILTGAPLIDLLAMKIQISPFSIVWAKTDRTFSTNIRTMSMKLRRSYSATGIPSGYTFVSDCLSSISSYDTFFALKWGETGIVSWCRTAEHFYETITDAESFKDKLIFTTFGDFRHSGGIEINTYRLNTTTGALEEETIHFIPGYYVHDPKIALDIIENHRAGYFLTFNRDDGLYPPVVISCKNDGSIRWSKQMDGTYQSYGILERQNKVFMLARPLSSVPSAYAKAYSQFVLDKFTGNVVLGQGSGFEVLQQEGDRPHYLKGYDERPLSTFSVLDTPLTPIGGTGVNEGLTVSWVREYASTGRPYPYDCPTQPSFSVSNQSISHISFTGIPVFPLLKPVLRDTALSVHDIGDKVSPCDSVSSPPRQAAPSIEADLSLSSVQVFPNPAAQHLILRAIPEGLLNINIRDFRGKSIRQQTFSDAQEIKLNIEDLAGGVYLLQMQQGDQVVSRKFVKQ